MHELKAQAAKFEIKIHNLYTGLSKLWYNNLQIYYIALKLSMLHIILKGSYLTMSANSS
jgi:hypothetical protein